MAAQARGCTLGVLSSSMGPSASAKCALTRMCVRPLLAGKASTAEEQEVALKWAEQQSSLKGSA